MRVVESLEILEAVSQNQPVSVGVLARLWTCRSQACTRAADLSRSRWLRQTGGGSDALEVGARILGVRPAALRGGSLYAACTRADA